MCRHNCVVNFPFYNHFMKDEFFDFPPMQSLRLWRVYGCWLLFATWACSVNHKCLLKPSSSKISPQKKTLKICIFKPPKGAFMNLWTNRCVELTKKCFRKWWKWSKIAKIETKKGEEILMKIVSMWYIKASKVQSSLSKISWQRRFIFCTHKVCKKILVCVNNETWHNFLRWGSTQRIWIACSVPHCHHFKDLLLWETSLVVVISIAWKTFFSSSVGKVQLFGVISKDF